MVDVVEESLDVYHQEGGGEASFLGGLDIVGEGKNGVVAGRVGLAAKLFRRGQLVVSDFVDDSASHDFFNQFPDALEKLDGVPCLGVCIRRFLHLGNDNDSRGLPVRVVNPEFDGSADDRREFVWNGFKGPFKDLVADARGAGGGGI